MALHSIFGTSIQVGEGDDLEVRFGPENAPERIMNTSVNIVHEADGDWTTVRQVVIPPFLGEHVVVLVCTVLHEVPEVVVDSIRRSLSAPPPSRKRWKWWQPR